MAKPVAPPPITQAEIMKAIKIDSPKVIEEVYKLAQRQFDLETARLTRVETKAASLLTASGASLTFVFSFGLPALLKRRDALWNANPEYWRAVVVLSLLAVGIGLFATSSAVRAMLAAKNYRALNERTLFDQERLHAFDSDQRLKEDDDGRAARFRRYVLPELWEIVQYQTAAAETKGVTLGRGQIALFVFVCIAAAIAVAAIVL